MSGRLQSCACCFFAFVVNDLAYSRYLGYAHLQELEGDLPVLNILPDKPRPALQTFNGTEVWFELTKEVKYITGDAAHVSSDALTCCCTSPRRSLMQLTRQRAWKAQRSSRSCWPVCPIDVLRISVAHANRLVLIRLPSWQPITLCCIDTQRKPTLLSARPWRPEGNQRRMT